MAPPDGVFGDPASLFGRPTSRIDGAPKVTGAARYASDEPLANPAFAYLVTSAIARGRVSAFSLDAAKAVPGVLDILTHENVGDQVKTVPGMDGGPPTTTLESDRIWHDGQIIAVVVADTFEAAREAANKVEVSYIEQTPSATFDSPGAETEPHKPMFGPDPQKGRCRRRVCDRAGEVRGQVCHADTASQCNRAVHHKLRLGRAETDRL